MEEGVFWQLRLLTIMGKIWGVLPSAKLERKWAYIILEPNFPQQCNDLLRISNL